MRKEAFSRRSRAKRAKKCTKKCDARAKLLSMDLKVPYELASTLKPYFAMLGEKYDYRVLKSRDFLIL